MGHEGERGGGGGERGKGHLTKVYKGRLYPKFQPLTLLHTIFDRQHTPAIYLVFKNDTPFMHPVQKTASLLTTVHATFFNMNKAIKCIY